MDRLIRMKPDIPGTAGRLLFLAHLILLGPVYSKTNFVTLLPEPGITSNQIALVQKTVDSFDDILGSTMGVTLDHPVRLYICPNLESYARVLNREFRFSPEKAEREARLTGGFSQKGSNMQIVIKFTGETNDLRTFSRAFRGTAHELFHQIQGQFSGRYGGRAYYWLKEGTADLVGARVAEKLGYQTVEKWKWDQLAVLRKSATNASPEEIIHTDLEKWTTLLEKKLHPYEMADLMTLHLIRSAGEQGYARIADYFRFIGLGTNADDSFRLAFRLEPDNMIQSFKADFARMYAGSAELEILRWPESSTNDLGDFQDAARFAQTFFTGRLGRDLRGGVRLFVVQDKTNTAGVLQREFGYSASEAEEKARRFATWQYSGSTAVMNAGALPGRHQKIFSTSEMLAAKLIEESGMNFTNTYWLRLALVQAIPLAILKDCGVDGAESYGGNWKNTLKKTSDLPTFTTLSSPALWQEAQKKSGSRVLSAQAGLAGGRLFQNGVPENLFRWNDILAETGSPEKAFQKIFEKSIEAFQTEIGIP
ncbi:MAG: hypothetical protein JNM63_05865 [Spirochaetia bacterium]|nr:hypothetical protein [Spirochaetia bacterium]